MRKQRRVLPSSLAVLLTAAGLLSVGSARADGIDRSKINLTYHGGPLIQNVKVVTLFWGSYWQRSSLPGYYNQCLKDLFADGRYMANLAQYSAGGSTIHNGSLAGTITIPDDPPAHVSDALIRFEIQYQIVFKGLPDADADTLYMVFTPPGVVVDDGTGGDSEHDFLGYHDYANQGTWHYAYAVIPDETKTLWGDPRLETMVMCHELAEAVTDPQPENPGWYDPQYGEVADIPVALYYQGDLPDKEFGQILTGPDGARYVVVPNWSNQDKRPVAFAPAAAPVQ